MDRGVWTAKTVKEPRQQPAHPQYANYWAPLTRKPHILPHPAQPQHTNYWAPRTRERHQEEHRPQRPTERSDPTQHAKGRTGDCPGPRKGATTRRNVTQGVQHILQSKPMLFTSLRRPCTGLPMPPNVSVLCRASAPPLTPATVVTQSDVPLNHVRHFRCCSASRTSIPRRLAFAFSHN